MAESLNLESELQHLRDLLAEHQKMDDLQHGTAKEALKLASDEINRRLTEMNNFREQLQQERNNYVPRTEHELLAERLKILEIARGEAMGKAAAYASIAGFIGVAAAMIGHYWR